MTTDKAPDIQHPEITEMVQIKNDAFRLTHDLAERLSEFNRQLNDLDSQAKAVHQVKERFGIDTAAPLAARTTKDIWTAVDQLSNSLGHLFRGWDVSSPSQAASDTKEQL
jgi:hypothetical protein